MPRTTKPKKKKGKKKKKTGLPAPATGIPCPPCEPPKVTISMGRTGPDSFQVKLTRDPQFHVGKTMTIGQQGDRVRVAAIGDTSEPENCMLTLEYI